MRIVITENQEKLLVKYLLSESEGEQNLEVFKYINSLFRRTKYINPNGLTPKEENIAVWIKTNKPASKDMVFNVVQEKFKNLASDRESRDSRLHDIVDAWFEDGKKYNKETGTILA